MTLVLFNANLVDTTITFTDPEGKRGTTTAQLLVDDLTKCTPDDLLGFAGNLASQLQEGSVANINRIACTIYGGGTLTLPTEGGKNDSIEDKAELVYNDATGKSKVINLPAPQDAMFLTGDNETVDPSAPAVADILSALDTPGTGSASAGGANLTWVTGAQHPPTTYIRGTRQRRKTRRKFRPGISKEQGGN